MGLNRSQIHSAGIETMLKEAVDKHRNGKLDQARDLYDKIVHDNPNDSDVLHLLGVLEYQSGLFDRAIKYISRAIQISPHRADFYHNIANALRSKGSTESALQNYGKAIALKPDYIDAYLAAGLLLEKERKTDEAFDCYRKALMIDRNSPEILCQLGSIYLQRKELVQAVRCYNTAIEYAPNLDRAYNGLGVALKESGDHERAISAYQKAISLSPEYAQAHYNLGLSFCQTGNYSQAAKSYKQTLAIAPLWIDALLGLGDIYFKLENIKDAILYYRRALELKPDLVSALNNIGRAYHLSGRIEEAIGCFNKVLELKPDFEITLKNFGLALFDLGKYEGAEKCFEKLLEHHPKFEYEVLMAMFHPVVFESIEAIAIHREKFKKKLEYLRSRDEIIENPYEQIGLTNFLLAMHGHREKEIREEIAELYLKISPHLSWQAPQINKTWTNNKIRVGFVSEYFREHTIGRLYHGIIENLSKNNFEIIIFHYTQKKDSITDAINHRADKVVYLPKKLKDAREIIAGQRLDILFYPELGMDPFTYFLSFSRLAPVQCKRGFQITMGIPAIDYFISSKWAEPEGAEDHYSEELVQLNRTGYYYKRPILPEKIWTKKELGLPEGERLYVCAQSIFKLHPEFDSVIRNILQRDENGVLILIKGLYPNWETLLLNRFRKTMPDVISRIYFVPRMQRDKFVSVCLHADAVLDTIYISGGNTSLECFAFGVPVITWPSAFLPGRLTYGFYRQMNIMDCVADDLEHYADLAVKLANNKRWYNEVKCKIEERSQILFEDKLAVEELEDFFQWALVRAYGKNTSASFSLYGVSQQ